MNELDALEEMKKYATKPHDRIYISEGITAYPNNEGLAELVKNLKCCVSVNSDFGYGDCYEEAILDFEENRQRNLDRDIGNLERLIAERKAVA